MFNGSFLADPLKVVTQDSIRLLMNTLMDPGMMECGSMRYIVMPIRE